MMRLRKIVRLGLAAILMTGGLALAAPAGTAEAYVSRNGKCEVGEFCLYYLGRSIPSSVSDFGFSVTNYGDSQPSCYEFKGPGPGQSQCVKNNAIGYWNRTNKPVTVFVLRNYNSEDGEQTVTAGASGNLASYLRDNNASHCIGC